MDDDQRLARAAEAFVMEALERSRSHEPHPTDAPNPRASATAADPATQARPPSPGLARERPPRDTAELGRSHEGPWPRRAADRRASAPTIGTSMGGGSAAVPPPILSRPEWSSAIQHEAARWHRHGGSVALLAIRLARRAQRPDAPAGDAARQRPGDDPQAAQRYAVPLGDTIRQRARASDRVARLGPDAFAVMLLEAGESAAMAYADRIRSTCEPWIQAVPGDLVLRIGWAVPHLGDSIERAAADVIHEVEEETMAGAVPTA